MMFATSNDWIDSLQSKQLVDGLYGTVAKFELQAADSSSINSNLLPSKRSKKTKLQSDKKFTKKLKLKRKKQKTADHSSPIDVARPAETDAVPKAEKPPSIKRKTSGADPEMDLEDADLHVAGNAAEPSEANPVMLPKNISKTKKLLPREGYLDRAEKRMKGSRFRMLNEKLYTTTGQEAFDYFEVEPEAFQEYHEGYREQMAEWPENPNNVMAEWLKTKPANWIVADLGCGEALLATRVPQQVHSFDLVALNERVTVADISNIPLPNEAVDVAVFCLSLMGTNVIEFLVEAWRILRTGGILKIAEVGSRFENIKQFIHKMDRLGFHYVKKEHGEKDYFVLFEFKKKSEMTSKETLPDIHLKPCIYKKR